MIKPAPNLFNNLWVAALAVASKENPSTDKLKNLNFAIKAIENACIINGEFKFENVGVAK